MTLCFTATIKSSTMQKEQFISFPYLNYLLVLSLIKQSKTYSIPRDKRVQTHCNSAGKAKFSDPFCDSYYYIVYIHTEQNEFCGKASTKSNRSLTYKSNVNWESAKVQNVLVQLGAFSSPDTLFGIAHLLL